MSVTNSSTQQNIAPSQIGDYTLPQPALSLTSDGSVRFPSEAVQGDSVPQEDLAEIQSIDSDEEPQVEYQASKCPLLCQILIYYFRKSSRRRFSQPAGIFVCTPLLFLSVFTAIQSVVINITFILVQFKYSRSTIFLHSIALVIDVFIGIFGVTTSFRLKWRLSAICAGLVSLGFLYSLVIFIMSFFLKNVIPLEGLLLYEVFMLLLYAVAFSYAVADVRFLHIKHKARVRRMRRVQERSRRLVELQEHEQLQRRLGTEQNVQRMGPVSISFHELSDRV